MPPATAARLDPLPLDQLDDSIRAQVEATPAYNLFATLGRHPALARRFMRFGNHFLAKGVLPPRDRELLILRTAWNAGIAYEWGHHVRLARAAGLSEAEIDRAAQGPQAPGWSAFDRALLLAADELFDEQTISDSSWSALAARYGEAQLLELPMLVGEYVMLGMLLGAVGVKPDPGLAPMPSR